MKNECPTNSDIAHALKLAVKYKLLGFNAVRNWADTMIETADVVEPWMINLSFCTSNDALFYLDAVPGVVQTGIAKNILFGLTHEAYRSGAIDKYRLRDIGWAVYHDDRDAPSDHWGLDLDLAIETHIDGYATILDIETTITETLETLAPFVASIPESLKRGITKR